MVFSFTKLVGKCVVYLCIFIKVVLERVFFQWSFCWFNGNEDFFSIKFFVLWHQCSTLKLKGQWTNMSSQNENYNSIPRLEHPPPPNLSLNWETIRVCKNNGCNEINGTILWSSICENASFSKHKIAKLSPNITYANSFSTNFIFLYIYIYKSYFLGGKGGGNN